MQIWSLDFHDRAKKRLRDLPKEAQGRIVAFFEKRVLVQSDPLSLGTPLKGDMSGLHRFRVGNYRIITNIDHGKMIILALEIGHRREVYKKTRH